MVVTFLLYSFATNGSVEPMMFLTQSIGSSLIAGMCEAVLSTCVGFLCMNV